MFIFTPTDGLARGVEAEDTGEPISVPVGEACLGRLFDVTGTALDGLGEVKSEENGKYTVILRHLKNRNLLFRCLKLVLRLSTSSLLLPRVERPVFRWCRCRQDGYYPGAYSKYCH